jgi:hypothetical protein
MEMNLHILSLTHSLTRLIEMMLRVSNFEHETNQTLIVAIKTAIM